MKNTNNIFTVASATMTQNGKTISDRDRSTMEKALRITKNNSYIKKYSNPPRKPKT